MDILKILMEKIDALPNGEHSHGLEAVRQHIETSIRHHKRGQTQSDDSAFTDVIYRCNLAFEGSVKEAYRVLAGVQPERITPAQIEDYLIKNELLKPRVLDQLKNYRTQWRNPSTHDYKLVFDEDEALLATVSVTVFAIVLCDQIAGKLAFTAAQTATSQVQHPINFQAPLLDIVADSVKLFASKYEPISNSSSEGMSSFFQLEGALAGHLTAELEKTSEIQVDPDIRDSNETVDLLVSRKFEVVAVEIKFVRGSVDIRPALKRALAQVNDYRARNRKAGAVIFIFGDEEQEYNVSDGPPLLPDGIKLVTSRSRSSRLLKAQN